MGNTEFFDSNNYEFNKGCKRGVYLIHGFTNTTFEMLELAKFLKDNSIYVKLDNLPGHGTTIDDCNATKYTEWIEHVERGVAESQNNKAIRLCGYIEMEISSMDPEDRKMFLAEYNLPEPGLNKLIHSAYELLGLETYFTAGEKEVRAWTIKNGFTAPEAAGVIHSDFQRGFIKAEIYHYDELIEYRSESKLKEAGKIRQEGKSYTVIDGDIIFFKFNV